MADEPDLKALVAFLPRLTRPGFSACEFKGGGQVPLRTLDRDWPRNEAVTLLPYAAFGETVLDFIRMAHDEGWVSPSVDWPEWSQTKEARDLVDLSAALDRATIGQLQKLLTWRIRAEKFSEGSLLGDFETGLIQRILRRADEILNDTDTAPEKTEGRMTEPVGSATMSIV